MSSQNDALVRQASGKGRQMAASSDNVAALVQRLEPQMRLALPRHLDPDRFARLCLTALRTTPGLATCTAQSLMGALMQCAQLGLEPGVGGLIYLIPFKRRGVAEVQVIVGYRGLIQLARRSGDVLSVEAHAVHERDHYVHRWGLHPVLEHEPAEGDRGDLRRVYCIVRVRDSEPVVEVMSKAEVDAIRARSRAGDSGPWVTDYEQMALKTVARRALKWAPFAIEVARAESADGAVVRGLSEAGAPLLEAPYQAADATDETPASQAGPPPGPEGEPVPDEPGTRG